MPSPRLPTLTEADIRAVCTSQSFARGQSYYRSGAILNPQREGYELRAQCQGSDWEPYEVEALLNEKGLTAASCSCPYDWGGYCKHIVALLLTYVHDPEAFEVIDAEAEKQRLAQLSRDELIDLVQQMLQEQPSLRSLLPREDHLPPSPDEVGARSVDWEAVLQRHQAAVQNVWRRFGRGGFVDYAEASSLGRELEREAQRAQAMARRGDFQNAVALLTALFERVAEGIGEVDDSDGVVSGAALQAVEALAEIVPQAGFDPPTRQAWQQRMLEHWLDDEYGIGEGIDGLLLRTAAPEDLDGLKEQTLEALRRLPTEAEPWATAYREKRLRRFLLALLEQTGDEAAYVELCEQEGFDLELAQHLLRKGWVNGAVAHAQQSFQDLGDFLTFTQDLLTAGHLAEARLVAEQGVQGPASQDHRRRLLEELLVTICTRQGDWNAALDGSLRLFKTRPSLDGFKQAVEAARHLGREEAVAGDLIRWLAGDPRHVGVLIQVRLLRGEHDGALALLPQLERYNVPLRLQVADAVQDTHPRAAMQLYQAAAEEEIGRADRRHYQTAASYLSQARAIAQRHGLDDDWDRYLQKLRQDHARRPALWDEIRKAGL